MPPPKGHVPSKRCGGCNRTRPLTCFYPNRARAKYDGLAVQCKDCTKKAADAWSKRNPQKRRVQHKKRRDRLVAAVDPRFLITKKLCSSRECALRFGYRACTATTDELMPGFSTRCQVCSEECGSGIHLDHCHQTGRFRGWLCGSCNSAIGHARDSIERLQALMNYLGK